MTQKFNQTLFAGLTAFLATGALASVASADVTVGTAKPLTVNMATEDDPARVQIPNGGTAQDAYLRKTDEEFTNEQQVVAFNGAKGLSIEMRSGSLVINGVATPPPGRGNRMQGACVPVELTVDGAGVIGAKKNPGEAWLTANNGNEYRNFNFAEVDALSPGTATSPALFLVKYNAQINGNDTKSYGVVVDENCNIIPTTGGQNGQAAATATNPGVVLIAKNNDDCSMAQDGDSGKLIKLATDEYQKVQYAGCNGNGRDDGWANSFGIKINRDAAGAPVSAKITKFGDVSINSQEERGRGTCIPTAANFSVCGFTSGNNQPQREGTWLVGLDTTPGAAPKILWRKQVEGRKQLDLGGGKKANTYSSRLMIAPVLDANLNPTDKIIVRTGDLQGNNQNNRKGGRYLSFQTGIVTVSPTAAPEISLSNMQSQIAGLDGTHLVMAAGVFGAAATPGVVYIQGSHTALAGAPATAKLMTVEGDKLVVEPGTLNMGVSMDRHLYSNYLGNNPGNQGRNFSKAMVIANPLYGTNGNKDKVLLVTALNGKDPTQALSKFKPSTYISIMPVVSDAAASSQSGSGTGAGAGGAGNEAGGTDGDTSVGGCSTGSGGTGLASLLLLGLVAIRRRRA